MDRQMLRSVSFLKNLPDEDLDAFAGLLTEREFAAKEQIVAENTPIHALYIVLSGNLHVRRKAQKREMLLARLGPGSFFGEVNLYDPGFATASIYAMDKVVLGIVDYLRFRDFMASNPALGYKIVSGLVAELARRLRATNERFVNSMYWSSLNAPPQ